MHAYSMSELCTHIHTGAMRGHAFAYTCLHEFSLKKCRTCRHKHVTRQCKTFRASPHTRTHARTHARTHTHTHTHTQSPHRVTATDDQRKYQHTLRTNQQPTAPTMFSTASKKRNAWPLSPCHALHCQDLYHHVMRWHFTNLPEPVRIADVTMRDFCTHVLYAACCHRRRHARLGWRAVSCLREPSCCAVPQQRVLSANT
jgi:hypothetical protein